MSRQQLRSPLSHSVLLLAVLLACKSDGEAKRLCELEFKHLGDKTGWQDQKQCAETYTGLKKGEPKQFACIQACGSSLQGSSGSPEDPLSSPSMKYMICKGTCTGGAASAEAAELGTPDVEITAEDLAKEYAKDAHATVKKYQGKTLKVSGKIDSLSVYEDQGVAYVRLNGAFFKDPHKWMDVTCNTVPSSYAKFMEPKVKAIGSGELVGSIQGKFNNVYPESPNPSIELEPCTYIEPKQ